MEKRLLVGSKKFDPLVCGGTVVVQNKVAEKTGKSGKWTMTGEVVDVLPFNSYFVLLHGSIAPTQRNRRFFKKITLLLSQFPTDPPLPRLPTTRTFTRTSTCSKTSPTTAEPASQQQQQQLRLKPAQSATNPPLEAQWTVASPRPPAT